MNTLDLIENDFKQLQAEMKKKYTNIKDVRLTHSLIQCSRWTGLSKSSRAARGRPTKPIRVSIRAMIACSLSANRHVAEPSDHDIRKQSHQVVHPNSELPSEDVAVIPSIQCKARYH